MRNQRNHLLRIICCVIMVLGCSTALLAQDTKGRVIGVVRDERNDVLPLVTIEVEGADQKLKSSVSGDYELELAPGSYSLLFSFASFETRKISDVVVKAGEVTRLDVVMTAGTKGQLENVVVTASLRETVSSVLRIQKNNVAVSDVLSIEQIKRTPDNNVAESLKRINGVTVVENKFVVVRGMGERYNNILLNGSQLPSTEANKKNFSFDMLPSNLIDNIVVNKTATPDLPAEFAGGIVQVNTKDVPDRNTLNIAASGGYNTKATFRDFHSTVIDDREYLGKVDDYRNWYLKKWDPGQYFQARSSSDVLKFNQTYRMNTSIPNTWGLHNYQALPTQEYMINGGLRFRFRNKSSFGFILGVNYRNEQQADDYLQKTIFNDSVSGKRYHFTTNLGGLASVSYNIGKHKFSFKNVYTRRLNHETFEYSGQDVDLNYIEGYISDILTTEMLQNRIEGEHVLTPGGMKVKWYADRSDVKRIQPDYRAVRYRQTPTEAYPALVLDLPIIFYDQGGIFATDLKEERYSAGADLQVPFRLLNDQQKFKAGVFTTKRTADFSSIALRPGITSESYRDQLFGLPDYLTYTIGNFKDGIVTYRPASTNSTKSDADTYSGDQDMLAFYGMLDFAITPKLRLIGGVRAEDYSLTAKTVIERDSIGKVARDSTFGISEFKLFPSLNLVYSLSERSNLRAAFSKTVSRFDFREGSPLKYFDFANYGTVFGNPLLKHAFIYNYDLRFEWYPASSEIISLSVFYKKFEDPIETLVQSGSNVKSYNYFYVNLKSSENTGVEADFRKSLGFIRKSSSFLNNLFIGGNASVMKSTVDVDRKRLLEVIQGSSGGGATIDTTVSDVRERPLQGLSPYAINIYLLYQGEKLGFNIAYNRFGRRLVFASSDDFQDIFESPRNVLDVQFFTRFFKEKLELKLNASDILNNSFIQYNNSVAGSGSVEENEDPKGKAYNPEYDFLFNQVKRGINFSLSLSYKIR